MWAGVSERDGGVCECAIVCVCVFVLVSLRERDNISILLRPPSHSHTHTHTHTHTQIKTEIIPGGLVSGASRDRGHAGQKVRAEAEAVQRLDLSTLTEVSHLQRGLGEEDERVYGQGLYERRRDGRGREGEERHTHTQERRWRMRTTRGRDGKEEEEPRRRTSGWVPVGSKSRF